MSAVWVESPGDDGSTVWGCKTCQAGGWCASPPDASLEAGKHAMGHGIYTVSIYDPTTRPGPKPDAQRDEEAKRLRLDGHSLRTIARLLAISPTTVSNALKRPTAPDRGLLP